jgi:hypothetical protein
MQGSNVTPQQALKTARAGLLTSLIAATKALESADASPGLVAQALQGVVNAEVGYNNAVVRIPLSVMTDGTTEPPAIDRTLEEPYWRLSGAATVPVKPLMEMAAGQTSSRYSEQVKELREAISAANAYANRPDNDTGLGPVDVITMEQAEKMLAEADVVHQVGPPAQLFGNANPRKWADTFLAENKNRTIVREELVNWFGGAMTEGAKAALEQGATAPRRDP